MSRNKFERVETFRAGEVERVNRVFTSPLIFSGHQKLSNCLDTSVGSFSAAYFKNAAQLMSTTAPFFCGNVAVVPQSKQLAFFVLGWLLHKPCMHVQQCNRVV